MKSSLFATTFYCAAACCLITSASVAQDRRFDTVPPDTVRPQPVCKTTQPVPVIIEAENIQGNEEFIRASGGVLFLSGTKKLTASEAWYDLTTGKGQLKDATFTTCTGRHPDYLVKADEVTLLPNNKIHMRGASLYLGHVKVIYLPSLKMNIGSSNSNTSLFPRPGYNKVEGYTLSQTIRLVDKNRARTVADLVLTSKHGLEGQVSSEYGFAGNIVDFPGRYMSYESMRSSAFALPQPPAQECDPQNLRPVDPARLRAFGVFSLRQQTYDFQNEKLVVYRQPELGLSYVGKQINPYKTPLDPRLEIYPEMDTSWGRFKEVPGLNDYSTRSRFGITLPVNVLPLGSSTSLQAILHYDRSQYSTDDTYETTAYAFDIAHMYSNGSFISGRYIKRDEFGKTPFQFDNVDINHEWQGGIQVRRKPHILGLVVSYNADEGNIYDWEVQYGYQTDCITSWIRWHQRTQRISFDVKLINM